MGDTSWLSGLIAAGGSIIGSAINAGSQYSMNKESLANQNLINQLNLDFAGSQTQAQWERDDSMHVREVNDLRLAGLSPLASLNGEMSTPAVVSGPNQATAQFVAPQVDVNSFVQSALGAGELGIKDKQLSLERDKLNLEADRLGKEDKWHNDEIQTKLMQIENDFQSILNESEQIRINDKKVMAEIKSINNAIEISQNTLKEQIAHNKFIEHEQFENDRFIRAYDKIKELTPSGMRYIACFDDYQYTEALSRFQSEYKQALIDVFGSDVAQGIMKDGSNQTLAAAGSGSNGSTLGVISLGANKSKTFARDISSAQREQWNKKLSTLRFPIPFSKDDRDLFDDSYTLRTYGKDTKSLDFRGE